MARTRPAAEGAVPLPFGFAAMLPTKPDLRNRALKCRDGVDPETRARLASRLAELGARLVSELPFACGRPVTALFAPVGSEPDPGPLAAALHARGLPLALPVDWSHGTPLIYRRWAPGEPLAAGPLGIGEPLPDQPPVVPDVLFFPVLAFDRRGYRVGYGAGNVDRTLRALRVLRPLRVIGTAYAVQEEARIPDEPHDERVDLILTERDLITASDAPR